jgi:hypothetical protein
MLEEPRLPVSPGATKHLGVGQKKTSLSITPRQNPVYILRLLLYTGDSEGFGGARICHCETFRRKSWQSQYPILSDDGVRTSVIFIVWSLKAINIDQKANTPENEAKLTYNINQLLKLFTLDCLG